MIHGNWNDLNSLSFLIESVNICQFSHAEKSHTRMCWLFHMNRLSNLRRLSPTLLRFICVNFPDVGACGPGDKWERWTATAVSDGPNLRSEATSPEVSYLRFADNTKSSEKLQQKVFSAFNFFFGLFVFKNPT